MKERDEMEGERIMRETLPTISFTAKLSHKQWIEAQAELRKVSKSEVIRVALDTAMRSTITESAVAA